MTMNTTLSSLSRTAKLAWVNLGWLLLVILWGAFVRASGSGAGCGEHWPLCNGQVIPRSPKLETLIEFSHRLTSGTALILVVALAVSAFTALPRGHAVRKGAAGSVVFIITEALVGAGLVLLGLVGVDASQARAWVMMAHLLNTFVLLAWITLTAAWASGLPAGHGRMGLGLQLGLSRNRRLLSFALLGMLLSGTTGAIAALGDTLFPATSLAHGLAQDFSETSHFLLKLRVWHPVAACLTAVLIWLATHTEEAQSTFTQRLGHWVSGIAAGQVVFGFLNALLLAPNWMQLVHLALADTIWILLVLYAASRGSDLSAKSQA
jgi:cytochrome c oxidase assembly protein subunit 15